VKDVLEAEVKVSDFIDQFCEQAEFTESEEVSAYLCPSSPAPQSSAAGL